MPALVPCFGRGEGAANILALIFILKNWKGNLKDWKRIWKRTLDLIPSWNPVAPIPTFPHQENENTVQTSIELEEEPRFCDGD